MMVLENNVLDFLEVKICEFNYEGIINNEYKNNFIQVR